jgi:hypothetical protein
MQADSRRERSSAHCWSQTAPGKKAFDKLSSGWDFEDSKRMHEDAKGTLGQ